MAHASAVAWHGNPFETSLRIALTERAPLAGCHLDAGLRAALALEVEMPEGADDAFWPLLGYCCGSVCGSEIPLIRGLETSAAGPDALKAFGAAFATVAAAPMFHIAGITPEADGQRPERQVRIGLGDLRRAWEVLNTATLPEVGRISLGNPHFSLDECARLAALVRGPNQV
ncbi:aconitase X [Microvirga sp. GCM10011540]|uniref:aconitase X n=1 Tax=Microvirga sp. GCM10011540 TaxID=3317338 RepID=UPI003611E29D